MRYKLFGREARTPAEDMVIGVTVSHVLPENLQPRFIALVSSYRYGGDAKVIISDRLLCLFNAWDSNGPDLYWDVPDNNGNIMHLAQNGYDFIL